MKGSGSDHALPSPKRPRVSLSEDYLRLKARLGDLQGTRACSTRSEEVLRPCDRGVLGSSLSSLSSLTFQPVAEKWKSASLTTIVIEEEGLRKGIRRDCPVMEDVSTQNFVQLEDDEEMLTQPQLRGDLSKGQSTRELTRGTCENTVNQSTRTSSPKNLFVGRDPLRVEELSPIVVCSASAPIIVLSSQSSEFPCFDTPSAQEVVSIDSDSDVMCSACTCRDSFEDNPIVYCDGKCNSAVHIQCYGLNQVPVSKFVCEGCRANDISAICVLCQNNGGLMRRSECGRWVHPVCVLFTGELTVGEQSMRANNLSSLNRERMNLVCFICRKRGGVQCAYQSCLCAYHPSCAFSSRVQMVIREETHSEIMHYDLFCEKHRMMVEMKGFNLVSSTFDILKKSVPHDSFDTQNSSPPACRRKKLNRYFYSIVLIFADGCLY